MFLFGINKMKKHSFLLMIIIGFILLWGTVVFASTITRDIILMLDNSGSMKKGDPNFVIKDAVIEFVRDLSSDTRLAILIFDGRINLALPLTALSETYEEDILASLDHIDFRGNFTNIPAAMERAIYELKTKGREESLKSIIFITDGVVDTGDKTLDMDKTRWLRENLSEDAAENKIKIFGIAFTDSADLELIQSLAQKTKGEYFRASSPDDILSVFSKINQFMASIESVPVSPPSLAPPTVPAEPDSPTQPSPTVPAEPDSPTQPPPTVPAESTIEKEPIYVTPAPEPIPATVKSKKPAFPRIVVLVVIGAIVIIAVVVAILFWSRRKPRSRITPMARERHVGIDELLPRASLKDLSRVTEEDMFEISEKVTKIGRAPATKEGQINHIVINKDTISRQHAIIEYKNHSFWIIDQGSSNGTFLNKRRITDEMRLNHGDTISFYTYDFEFTLEDMANADPEALNKTVFLDKTAIQ